MRIRNSKDPARCEEALLRVVKTSRNKDESPQAMFGAGKLVPNNLEKRPRKP